MYELEVDPSDDEEAPIADPVAIAEAQLMSLDVPPEYVTIRRGTSGNSTVEVEEVRTQQVVYEEVRWC